MKNVCAKMFPLIFLLACQVLAAHAAKHPLQTMQQNGLTHFEQLVKIAGAHDALSKHSVRITILAPSDQAFKIFMKDMGITLEYLQQNEALADAILAYHLLLGFTASSADFTVKLAAKNKTSLKAMTAAEPDSVTLRPGTIKQGAAQQWLVRDVQGNVAHVTAADLGEGGHRVHVIDRVLYSGAYWPNFKKLFATMPKVFSAAQAAITKAGPAAAALVAEGSSNTLFLPTDAAFKKSGVSLAAPAADIAALLKFHVIAGQSLSIPGGFKQGAEVASMAGSALSVTYKQEGGVHKSSGLQNAAAYVALSGGSSAKVLSPNMFVSKAEVHVIDNVLKPSPPAVAATAALPTPAPPITTYGVSITTSGSDKTITINKPFLGLTVTLPTLPALFKSPVATSFVAAGAGRKLLKHSDGSLSRDNDGGLGDGHGADERDEYDFVNSLELNAEEQDVSVAVNSHAAANAVATAGSDAVSNIYEQNRFPVDPTYASGVTEASAKLMDNDAGSDGPAQSDD